MHRTWILTKTAQYRLCGICVLTGVFTRESLKAYKSLEAFTYFASGFVDVVMYNGISGRSPVCLLKAFVKAGQVVFYFWDCLDEC